MRGALACATTLALSVTITAVVPAGASRPTIVEAGWGQPLSINGGVLPKSLPKNDRVPVALGVSGKIQGRGETVPVLRKLTLDLDRDGALDVAGLPACSRQQLQASTKYVAKNCRGAQVGGGVAHLALAGQPEPSVVKLALFNGGEREGAVTAFLRAFIPAPVSAPVLAVVKVKPHDERPYGLRALTELPAIPGEMATLLDFNLTINRRLIPPNSSFAMARCRDGALNARLTSFELNTGELFSGPTFVRSCSATG